MSTFIFTADGVNYSVDGSYRYIGQQLSKLPVLSFNVKKLSENNWYLFVNQSQFCGRYPSQAACLGVVYGMYTAKSGFDDGFAVYMADALTKGSVIDPDVNLLTLTDLGVPEAGNEPRISVVLTSFDQAGGFIKIQSSENGSTWTDTAMSTPVVADGTFTFDQNSFDAEVTENFYYRAILQDLSLTLLSTSNILIRNEVDDTNLVFTLDLSGEDESGFPIIIGQFAHAVVDDSASVLDPGESISYTYEWFREIPTLTGIGVDPPVGVAPTLTASGDQAADSLTVGDTASVTASATGTETITISYQWKVDDVNSGSNQATFDTSGLSGGEVLTCVVTATNAYGTDTATISFGTVASSTAEWENGADGIWQISSWSGTPSGSLISASTAFDLPTSGWYENSTPELRGRDYSVTDSIPNYVVAWNVTDSVWSGLFTYDRLVAGVAAAYVPTGYIQPQLGDEIILIWYATDPTAGGSIPTSTWAPYNGPTAP